MTTFWSLYVTVLALGTIFALTWLLLSTRKGQRAEQTDETVGHSFDGIEEYDNPLPKWWFMLFVGTIVFALGYLVLYPGLGNWKGLLPGYQYLDNDKKTEFANGQKLFATNCVACHGPEGKGTPAMGAPNLTHPTAFIYGSSFAQLQQTIRYGRQGQMPAQEAIQGNDKVHLLAAYVYSLSHQPEKTAEAK